MESTTINLRGCCPDRNYPNEDMSHWTFWLFGVIVVLNHAIITESVELEDPAQPSKGKSASDLTGKARGCSCGHNARSGPSIGTTLYNKTRRVRVPTAMSQSELRLALALSWLVLLIQLIEGYWVLKIAWGYTAAVAEGIYADLGSWIARLVQFVLLGSFGLLMWAYLLIAGANFTSDQITWIRRLIQNQSGVLPVFAQGEKENTQVIDESSEII